MSFFSKLRDRLTAAADSDAAAEWRECLAKGEFVSAAGESFDLLETMPFDPVEGIQRLEGHLARMKASAWITSFSLSRAPVMF